MFHLSRCLIILLTRIMSTGQKAPDLYATIQSNRIGQATLDYSFLWYVLIVHLLSTEITKLLNKLTKEKGNEELQPWVKPCERHLYWSATSTQDGNGKVIWAKFKSFLSHIINRHTNLDDPLFNKCAHGDIPDRKWIDPGIMISLAIW